MNEREAKEKVINAGKRLVESGLIARTWGNVSCRISDSDFTVTPSGRDYLTLTLEEIVTVSISDLSYSGNIKPSSEKGIHAEIYKHNPNINFVIHTHQKNASVISAMGLDSISTDSIILGNEIICASYALPGTKRLRRNIAEALNRSKGNALIMKNHGAICFGKDDEEAFQVASLLEDACEGFILNQYDKVKNKGNFNLDKIKSLEEIRKQGIMNSDISPCFNSERSADGFILHNENKEPIKVKFGEVSSLLPEEAKIHNEVYLKYKNINYIIHSSSPYILTISRYDTRHYPLVDDFAQIVGRRVRTVSNNPLDISGALKNTSAVFIKNKGALCCASSEEDATAIQMVLEKNCKIEIYKDLFGNVKALSWLDSMLMRFVYMKKYSKQINSTKKLRM